MASENTETVSTYVDEVNDTTTYVGIAPRKSATSDAAWQIKKITVSGTVTSITFPNGNDGMKYVWDDRASYTYE